MERVFLIRKSDARYCESSKSHRIPGSKKEKGGIIKGNKHRVAIMRKPPNPASPGGRSNRKTYVDIGKEKQKSARKEKMRVGKNNRPFIIFNDPLPTRSHV